MKPSTKLFAVLLLAALPSTIAVAQESSQGSVTVPRLVSYSGRAVDARGKPIPGVAGVTFAIYKDQQGGAPLWLETQNVVVDAKGQYTVQLGATKREGLSVEIFNSKESRWLGVQVSGQEEQPRLPLLSVPYALKAADADTIGGLPPSAFVLTAPSTSTANSSSSAANLSTSAALPPTLNGSGTLDYLPLWTGTNTLGSSILFQTGTGSSAKVGINTTTPAATLDVKGSITFHGPLNFPAINTANATSGSNSQSETMVASAFNSSTSTAMNQKFRWQAEPVANNTSQASGSLSLLFAQGSAPPTETGLRISNIGRITFAPGQAFPGAGTVTNVGLSAPASDFTMSGSPVTGSGTLVLNWNIPPASANTASAIVKRDGAGNFQTNGIGVNKLVASSIAATTSSGVTNTAAVVGGASATGSGLTFGVVGFSSTDQGAGVYGNNNNPNGGYGVTGKAPNGAGVAGSGAWGFDTDSNVHQSAPFGGWVKAMLLVDGRHGGPYILRCFNSALSGAAANTVPCGFKAFHYEIYTGRYVIEIGYDISHNFVSALGVEPGSAASGALTVDCDCDANDINSEVMVNLYSTASGDFEDGKFYVVVY